MGKQNISKRPLETIKFRGFNAKNGKWIYGFYLQNRSRHFVVPDEFANGKSWEDYEVVPETVGQSLGLSDTKGDELWEDDLVEWDCFGRKAVYVCGWSDTFSAFYIANEHNHSFIFALDPSKLNIVGNIHDNPELLK